MNPYFYMMVGLPGSGKSTWIAKNIFDVHHVTVLSTDKIIEDMCKAEGITYSEGFQKYIDKATKMFNQELADRLVDGDNILIDRTNLSKASRRKILSRVPSDYKKVCVVVGCDDATLKDHLSQRPGKFIPEYVITQMKNSYEAPSQEEGFDSITVVDTSNVR